MKKTKSINYLEKIPVRAEHIKWSKDDEGNVTLEIENKGVFNKAAQKLLKKPKISYVHLEGIGNFIWQQLDGKKDVAAIGEDVEAKFGEKSHPLYERLIKYLQILESYGFISWNEE